jgi:hypothetical protein
MSAAVVGAYLAKPDETESTALLMRNRKSSHNSTIRISASTKSASVASGSSRSWQSLLLAATLNFSALRFEASPPADLFTVSLRELESATGAREIHLRAWWSHC